MTPTTIYLAGPMTGYPEWNHPEFNRVARELRLQGHRVLNPAENGADESKTWEAYMALAVNMLSRSKAVAFLKGWERSRGAKVEHGLARTLGLPCLDAYTLKPLPEPIQEHEEANPLLRANELIFGDRQASYGHPLDDFTKTAFLWTAHLRAKHGYTGPELEAEDVAFMMADVKRSRLMDNPEHFDSQVDGPGYWGCYHRIRMERDWREREAKEKMNEVLHSAALQATRTVNAAAKGMWDRKSACAVAKAEEESK